MLVMLSLDRPAAVKLALQIKGVDEEVSARMFAKLKCTANEMVNLMDKGYISYHQLRLLTLMRKSLFPTEAEVKTELDKQNKAGLAVETGVIEIDETSYEYSVSDFDKKVIFISLSPLFNYLYIYIYIIGQRNC